MIATGIQCGKKRVCFIAILLFVSFTFSYCHEAENTNCRAIFEQSYEVNIEAFLKTMPDTDPAIARKKAEYALNKLYEIDSTFVLLNGKELNDFIKKNLSVIEKCDSTD